MQSTVQVSRNNPGWQGPGEPDLQKIGAEWRPIANLLASGQLGASFHRTESALANAWNFHLRPRHRSAAACPCCGWEGPAFVATGNWRAYSPQSRCPRCDSRSRHRGLVRLLPTLVDEPPPGPILFFAPELVILNHLPQWSDRQVFTTDYFSTDVDFPGEDIQQLGFAAESYSLILCNHVLEHVPDDKRSLHECARVLVPGGLAVFTIPGDFDKPQTRVFDTPDSNGHFRHYGLDILEKMSLAFGHVEAVDMSLNTDPRWYIRPGDLAFVCRK